MHEASGGFFDVIQPEPPSEPEATPEPAWLRPPADELPGRVLLDRVLHRDPATVLLLREVAAYSTGLVLEVAWLHRRTTETAREWESRMLEQHRWFPGRFPDPDGMHVGVRLGDGTRLLPMDHQRVGQLDGDPAPPTLQILGGSGGGGTPDRFDISVVLWLWNGAPNGEPIELVVEWPALGLGETRVAITADVLADAPAPRRIWS